MAESSKDARARAELRFKRREKAATDAERAMADYLAEGETRRQKTAKLKALRLAEVKKAAALEKKKPAKARKKKAAR